MELIWQVCCKKVPPSTLWSVSMVVSETAFKNVWGLLVFLVWFFFLIIALLFWGFFKAFISYLRLNWIKTRFGRKPSPEELRGELVWGSEMITLCASLEFVSFLHGLCLALL